MAQLLVRLTRHLAIPLVVGNVVEHSLGCDLEAIHGEP